MTRRCLIYIAYYLKSSFYRKNIFPRRNSFLRKNLKICSNECIKDSYWYLTWSHISAVLCFEMTTLNHCNFVSEWSSCKLCCVWRSAAGLYCSCNAAVVRCRRQRLSDFTRVHRVNIGPEKALLLDDWSTGPSQAADQSGSRARRRRGRRTVCDVSIATSTLLMLHLLRPSFA